MVPSPPTTSPSPATLLLRVRRGLAACGDPERATGAQAYMKSTWPFLGVGAVDLRRVCRSAFADWPFPTRGAWRTAVLTLWRDARYREERYAAVELTGIRAARAWQTPDILPMYEEMIVTGAWWDVVDPIATKRIGPMLREHPRTVKPTLRRWAHDEHLWTRRTAILAQLHFKTATDLALLYDCIAPSMSSKEFFLRKAIGWALRQYARTDPVEVRRFVAEHRGTLSALTVREALKRIS